MSSSGKILTLKAFDGEEFLVEESVAIQSQLIKNIIEDDCASNTIPIPNVDGSTLAKVIEYCKKHSDQTVDLKKFDFEFVDVDTDVLYDLLMAANFLNIKGLLDRLCDKVADMVKGKMQEEIRKMFNIKNDFTAEEERQMRQENSWAFE